MWIKVHIYGIKTTKDLSRGDFRKSEIDAKSMPHLSMTLSKFKLGIPSTLL